ncbi:glycosyl hydrolase family 18 protein [Clostridium sp. A1-XYC3]|uniref:Glycosyl hydrolase family 18 protein n=1 Tax=Clostridium tanneri TaxID=3037988 RepID=A0ABU4JQS5_9CLOT|nr:glycosyl hydrolase family 18 protein [Clostridium sp. A1-XYC3]MDW8800482.1 glycosyl hydrolase family 18 protein [Clostridium sp. A1-XYC3]
MRKRLFFIGLVVLALLLTPVMYITANSRESNLERSEKKSFGEDIKNLSAWVVYWDLNSDKEIKALDKRLKNISYFAANFDSNNKLAMPEDLTNYYNKTKNDKYNKYITIVNDKVKIDGSYSLKDTSLLKALLDTPDSRSSHIEGIINLAVKHGFDGIEIDYEQIKKDMGLWNNYISFINELYEKAQNRGLKVRVVLEPNTPFDKLTFTEGPTYVLMCYNLHGGFNEPGEKANAEFIENSIESMSKVPGKKEFAIATGGFNWAANGKTTSVTEAQAVSLLKQYKATAQRHKESQSLFFTYTDENNMKHEVWYGDKVTLDSWMKVITEKGYDVSIWRLGGNLF